MMNCVIRDDATFLLVPLSSHAMKKKEMKLNVENMIYVFYNKC